MKVGEAGTRASKTIGDTGGTGLTIATIATIATTATTATICAPFPGKQVTIAAVTSIRQHPFDHGGGNGSNGSNGSCIGVLVTNLGSPDSCKPGDVRRYLREFLWDRRVVEAPRALWWLVLNLFILATRPRKSAAAYRKVWREDGAPLLAISRRQRRKLRQVLGERHPQPAAVKAVKVARVEVALGMRYGNPSIAGALAALQSAGMRKLLVLPLYPQYCAVTTASTFDAVCAELARWRWIPAVRMIDHYHDHPAYIRALANSVRDYRQTHGGGECLLMSFHGIPRAYFEAGDPYHCECHKTARLLAEELGLGEREWRVSFQSRFGAKPWLQPYTDQTLASLAQSGVRSVQVICPGFSADCLETLEEIAMENRAVFLRAGGENYGYIPCLNDRDDHIQMLAGLITDHLHGWRERDERDTAASRRAQKTRALAMGAKA